MGFTPTEKIWFNGKLVAWGDAKVHVDRPLQLPSIV